MMRSIVEARQMHAAETRQGRAVEMRQMSTIGWAGKFQYANLAS